MASIGSEFQVSRKANESLGAFLFVNILSTDKTQVELPDLQADNDWALGITEHVAAAAEHVDVRVGGVFKLKLNEAIALGGAITAGPGGEGADPDAGNYIRAIALEAGDADDIIEVLLVADPAAKIA